MATLYVAEFYTVGGTGNFPVQGAQVPPIAEQTVAISGTSNSCTNGFNANTKFVRIHTDAICSIAFTSPPTNASVAATTGNMRLVIGQTEYFPVTSGQKVSVITNT